MTCTELNGQIWANPTIPASCTIRLSSRKSRRPGGRNGNYASVGLAMAHRSANITVRLILAVAFRGSTAVGCGVMGGAGR